MRRGFDGLSAQVQTTLSLDPFNGAVFVFSGKRGDRIKLLWWDGMGFNLFYKRLEHGEFTWPKTDEGVAHLTNGQLSMLSVSILVYQVLPFNLIVLK